ncbi:MAG TPA: hypothetical protein VHQ92_15120 [Pseudolabrys sp.]|jgi:hypothetical protein|nr:hypothetical protein [Pseudolabrys sp.]
MSQEAKKPTNLRANAMPADGFVLTVDGKSKARYETELEALAAGSKLKQTYPAIRVTVFEPITRVYTPVELSETEASK